MSRYQVVKIIAALLCALALALRNRALFGSVIVALLTLIGLGVKIPQLRFFGPYVCRGANSRRCVALTFDDGPDPRSTPLLLELLRGAGQPAAFFCVGRRVAAHPELAARIEQAVEQGLGAGQNRARCGVEVFVERHVDCVE